jgi:hypothetical protein
MLTLFGMSSGDYRRFMNSCGARVSAWRREFHWCGGGRAPSRMLPMSIDPGAAGGVIRGRALTRLLIADC